MSSKSKPKNKPSVLVEKLDDDLVEMGIKVDKNVEEFKAQVVKLRRIISLFNYKCVEFWHLIYEKYNLWEHTDLKYDIEKMSIVARDNEKTVVLVENLDKEYIQKAIELDKKAEEGKKQEKIARKLLREALDSKEEFLDELDRRYPRLKGKDFLFDRKHNRIVGLTAEDRLKSLIAEFLDFILPW